MPALRKVEVSEFAKMFAGCVIVHSCGLYWVIVSAVKHMLTIHLQLRLPLVFRFAPTHTLEAAACSRNPVSVVLRTIGDAQIDFSIVERVTIRMVCVFLISRFQSENDAMHIYASSLAFSAASINVAASCSPCEPFPLREKRLPFFINKRCFSLRKFYSKCLNMSHWDIPSMEGTTV
jgi:hypothetical protein